MNFAWTRRLLDYGWIIAATLAVTQTISWGILWANHGFVAMCFTGPRSGQHLTDLLGRADLSIMHSLKHLSNFGRNMSKPHTGRH